jgi:hypothetical protein
MNINEYQSLLLMNSFIYAPVSGGARCSASGSTPTAGNRCRMMAVRPPPPLPPPPPSAARFCHFWLPLNSCSS